MTVRDGLPIWFELNTQDAAAAAQAYAALTGWTIVPSPMPEHGGYRIASAADGEGVAGIVARPPQAPAFPGWVIYFAIGDVDAAAERVKALGGAVGFGPMDIPHVGRFAMASDPQGITFALLTPSGSGHGQAFRHMAPGVERSLGHGVWIELATPDPEGALAFYGALFGWEKSGAMPMGTMGEYAFLGLGEARPGAVMSSTATGAPARWNWYVHVADIDAAVATAGETGGRLLQGPHQIPGGDYSAIVADPADHRFGLVGPRRAQ